MEDSYGSGVEDLSSAAAELAGARMAEQKRLQEEMRRLRGIQPGDRVKVRVRHGAPYPEPIKRYHYNAPFGGAGLGHRPSASPIDAFDPDAAAEPDEGDDPSDAEDRAGGGGGGKKNGDGRRWKIVPTLGYVVRVRGGRVGVKRNGHPEDTNESFPTYPKEWVEVLDVGEMWEMKTGPRNLGAFASDEDYAQAQAQWMETINAMRGGKDAESASAGAGGSGEKIAKH